MKILIQLNVAREAGVGRAARDLSHNGKKVGEKTVEAQPGSFSPGLG